LGGFSGSFIGGFWGRWLVIPPVAPVPRHVSVFVSIAALCRDGHYILTCLIPA
jgi:hypothetical protein